MDVMDSTYLARIRRGVTARARLMALELHFVEPRRESDLLLISLGGGKRGALRVSNYLLDCFKEVDVELVRSENEGGYRLLIAVTQKLGAQPSASLEQRGKLRRRRAAG